MELSEGMKEGICKRLVGYDKDIVEIIQFGSSVYAPEYARDLDLLVITTVSYTHLTLPTILLV